MVLIGVVKSSDAITNSASIRLGAMTAGMLAAVVVIHVATLYAGFGLGRLAKLDRPDWIAVGLAGSQKTLMIGLYIADDLNLGVGILAMVAYHAAQLIIDTVVADRLHSRKE